LNSSSAKCPSRRGARSASASGLADLESYRRFVLSTPDFSARLKSGAPMNEPDKSTYYAGGAKGYTDYPTLAEKAVA
jgi:N-ethylmaleimide reductase